MVRVHQTGHTGQLKACIGEELYIRMQSSRHLCVPMGSEGYFLTFFWCDIKNTHNPLERLSICCRGDTLDFFCENAALGQLLESQPEQGDIYHTLYEFLSALTAKDLDVFERLEGDINELEGKIITTEKPIKGVSARIIELRRSFLKMKRYYEQMSMVLDALIENENAVISPESLSRLRAMSRRVGNLSRAVLELRDYVTQVREAYQAKIDIEQNQIMKIFTVITAVFLPLTLIVGWYGMNFKMPEYNWPFGYIYVIILSILVCAVCFVLFRRRKWF